MAEIGISLVECACATAPALEDKIAALVLRVGRLRDREAFVALFGLAAPYCKGMLLARGVPEAVAEELAQETLAVVWHEAKFFDPARPGGALAWIYGIGRDQFLRARDRYLDRVEAERSSLAWVPEDGLEDGAHLEAARRVRRLRRALLRLPAVDTAVIRDVFVRGLSHAAVAKARNMPLGTVKARIRRAMRALKAHMDRPLD